MASAWHTRYSPHQKKKKKQVYYGKKEGIRVDAAELGGPWSRQLGGV